MGEMRFLNPLGQVVIQPGPILPGEASLLHKRGNSSTKHLQIKKPFVRKLTLLLRVGRLIMPPCQDREQT